MIFNTFLHKKNGNCRNRKGFTMIEILLVVVILVMVGGLSVPVYQSFQVKSDLDEVGHQVAQSFLRAQLLSQSSYADSGWGVSIQTGLVTIFKGADFSSRDISYDEVFEIPPSITPSGLGEVSFSKVFGIPQATGTVTFTSVNNENKSITISEKGAIEY